MRKRKREEVKQAGVAYWAWDVVRPVDPILLSTKRSPVSWLQTVIKGEEASVNGLNDQELELEQVMMGLLQKRGHEKTI
jgi:hypothetical protein